MLGVSGVITVKPGCEAEFERLARLLWAATHAVETGVHRYEYSRAQTPGVYLVSMLFDDYEAFLVHQASPHHTELAGAMRDIYDTIELQFTQPLEGGFGLPAERAPTGSEVSEELRTKYRTRYPQPDPHWWPKP